MEEESVKRSEFVALQKDNELTSYKVTTNNQKIEDNISKIESNRKGLDEKASTEQLDQKANKSDVTILQKLVYGFITIILSGVIGAMLKLVL